MSFIRSTDYSAAIFPAYVYESFKSPQQKKQGEQNMNTGIQKPSAAFLGASWLALLVGAAAYLIGLWNASMQLNEKGYYFIVLMYGLFAAVSVQKSVRDKAEGIAVTAIYFGLCWVSVLIVVLLLAVGLWKATLALSEKGFFGMSFVLSMFAVIAVQKNTRDATSGLAQNHG